MTLNLHALVRSVISLHPDVADPGELAGRVFAALDPEDHAAAVRIMLRGYVREVMNQHRTLPRATAPAGASGPRTKPDTGGSAFVRAMQQGAWKQRLAESYHTASGWKFLGECGRDDLLFIAAERRELAEANLEAADRAEKLAGLLEAHGASTVGELPETALEPVLA